jgi:UDP-N-acetylmuramoyl-L-alanyl-D-glutamate--2,6-diaminopimelate ligase
MKTIKDLTARIAIEQTIGSTDREISSVEFDSRKVTAGCMFIAICGTQSDGHAFIPAAIQQGAAAIVCQKLPDDLNDGVTYLRVNDSDVALGWIASAWFGYPSEQLTLTGVTGTNGKTTTATLLYQMFRRMGHKCGLLSTVCNYVEDKAIPATHTTPDPMELNGLLADMVAAGCDHAFMEVSSHSIAQQRIAGLDFDGGIFTNITRDHLDYHKTFDNYLHAKKKFFDDLPAKAFALTNLDDKNGLVMTQNTKARKLAYSIRSQADFRAKIIEDSFDGMTMEVNHRTVDVPFVGRFNASNLMAVYGAAVALGADAEEALVHLSALHAVNGRFEALKSPKGFTAIVDYAHTPDALVNVLSTIHEVLNGKGKVITVCGAGGNRDKGKRPMMAQEAVKASDKVIITSDNPRFEEPQDIINDMLAGLSEEQKANVVSIVDRKEAIRTACMLAQAGDVILVAGKGHENYQDVKGVKHHFDDKEVLRDIYKTQG